MAPVCPRCRVLIITRVLSPLRTRDTALPWVNDDAMDETPPSGPAVFLLTRSLLGTHHTLSHCRCPGPAGTAPFCAALASERSGLTDLWASCDWTAHRAGVGTLGREARTVWLCRTEVAGAMQACREMDTLFRETWPGAPWLAQWEQRVTLGLRIVIRALHWGVEITFKNVVLKKRHRPAVSALCPRAHAASGGAGWLPAGERGGFQPRCVPLGHVQ